MFGIGDKITITFMVFAELQSTGDKITVISIVFAELGTVPQITILVHTDLGVSFYLTTPLATYENPKLMAVCGIPVTFILISELKSA